MPRPRPRIAFVSEHADPSAPLGGAESGGQNVYVREMACALAGLGLGVDVFTRLAQPGASTLVQLGAGVRVFRVAAGPPGPLDKHHIRGYLDEFVGNVLDRVRRDASGYEVVHGHYYLSGWVGTQLARQLDVPLVQTFHSLGLARSRVLGPAAIGAPERLAVERQVCRAAEHIVALCDAERSLLARHYGVPASKLSVVPGGVDTHRFRPGSLGQARQQLGLPSDSRIVLYVGRTVAEKGLETLVRAIPLIGRAVKLLIVGGPGPSGPGDDRDQLETARLRRLARRLGVAPQVEFVGSVQHDRLPDYYRAADVCVLPSRYEPFGLAALEALSSGRPLVVADCCGVAELVREGDNGLVFPSGEAVALAAQLERVLHRPCLAAHLAAQARQSVDPGLAWSSLAAQLAAVYGARVMRTAI
jgi:D-inositol-3-phosphate glycosyltransferase